MAIPRRTITLTLAVAAASALAVALTVAARDSDVAASARRALQGGSTDYGRAATPVDLLKKADAIARITVDEIEGPMWNSRDGREWRGNDSTGIRIFSKVRARVDEVLYGDVPSSVEVFVFGDGAKRYEGSDVPEYASISGGFIVGQAFIVLLRRAPWPMENGNLTVWTLGRSFEGNWRIDATGRANGSDTKWSMSEAELRKFFSDNWQGSRAAQTQQ